MRRNEKDTLGIIIDILADAGEPVHYKQIAKLAIERGWTPLAGTAESAINAVLNGDLRERKTKSYFIKATRGVFKLRYTAKSPKIPATVGSKLEALQELCANIVGELEVIKQTNVGIK